MFMLGVTLRVCEQNTEIMNTKGGITKSQETKSKTT